MVSVPKVGPETGVTETSTVWSSPSGSKSLSNTFPVIVAPWFPPYPSSIAKVLLFPGFPTTLIVNTAESVAGFTLSSTIEYVKVSNPTNPELGVYTKLPSAFSTSVPFANGKVPVVVTVWLSPSTSTSFVNTLPSTGVSTSVNTASALAIVLFCPIGFIAINTLAESVACGDPLSSIL